MMRYFFAKELNNDGESPRVVDSNFLFLPKDDRPENVVYLD